MQSLIENNTFFYSFIVITVVVVSALISQEIKERKRGRKNKW